MTKNSIKINNISKKLSIITDGLVRYNRGNLTLQYREWDWDRTSLSTITEAGLPDFFFSRCCQPNEIVVQIAQ